MLQDKAEQRASRALDSVGFMLQYEILQIATWGLAEGVLKYLVVQDKAEQRALRALELLEHLFSWLVQYGRKQGMGPLLPEEAPAAAADGGSPAASQATSSPASPTSPATPQVGLDWNGRQSEVSSKLVR